MREFYKLLAEEKMMKAVFFDLDDTLLWDEKSVSTAFSKTCLKAEENTESMRKNLKQPCAKKRESFTRLMKHIHTPS